MSLTQLAKQSLDATVKSAYRPGLAADLAGTWNIFEVHGGPVLVTQLWGHVTTIIATAAVPILNFNPNVGGAAVLSIIMVTLDTDVAGTVYIWDGSLAVAAPVETAAIGMAAAGEGQQVGGQFVILVPGILYWTNAVAATGIIDWYINYIPCVPNAHIVAI